MAKKDSGIIDITSTGPLGYRALQYANAFQKPEQEEDLQGWLTDNQIDLNAGYNANPLAKIAPQTYTPQQLGVGDDIGSSMFDNDTYEANDLPRYQDIRAENQPWYTQAAAGILKGGILAGTTFVDGTVGLVYGLADAAVHTFDQSESAGATWSRIWDNPVTQTIDLINKESEKILPNYYTAAQQEDWMSTDNLLSTNFLFDKLVKNFGFMIGAYYSGGIWGAVAINPAFSVAGKFKGASSYLSKAASSGDMLTDAVQANKSLFGKLGTKWGAVFGKATDEELASAVAAGARAMEASRAARGTKSVVGSFLSAVSEGTVEAVGNSNDWAETEKLRYDEMIADEYRKILEEYELNKGKEIYIDENGTAVDPAYMKFKQAEEFLYKKRNAIHDQIEHHRKQMGNFDLITNIPILWLGDWVSFGKAYAGGWKAARNGGRAEIKAAKEAYKEASNAAKAGDFTKLKKINEVIEKAEKEGFKNLTDAEKQLVRVVADHAVGSKAGAIWAAAKEPLKEGNEEMAQAAGSAAAGFYAESKLDDDVDALYAAHLDPSAQTKVTGILDSVLKGMASTYGDASKWEEGLIGALTGAIGSPTFGRASNRTNQTWLGRNKMVGFTGGAVTQVRDYLNSRRIEDAAAQRIDDRLRDPDYIAKLRHLIAQTKFSNDMKTAVINDSKYDYENAEFASIVEDILYFKKMGRMDLLLNHLDAIEEFTEDDAKELLENTSKNISALDPTYQATLNDIKSRQTLLTKMMEDHERTYSEEAHQRLWTEPSPSLEVTQAKEKAFLAARDKSSQNIESLKKEIARLETKADAFSNTSKAASPYIKSDGTVMTAAEVLEDLKKRAKESHKVIQYISDAQEELDQNTGEAFTDEQLATLTWYKVMMRNWEERASSMATSVLGILKSTFNDPNTQALIKQIQELMDKDSEALDPNLKQIYGGAITTMKAMKDTIAFLEMGDALLAAANANDERRALVLGMRMANMLSSTEKYTNKKKDGTTEETTKGQALKSHLKALLDASTLINEDQKIPIVKQLDDLQSIGRAFKRYNELLEKFRKNPEGIEQAHEEMHEKKEKKAKVTSLKSIVSHIDWDAPVAEISKLLTQYNDDIKALGGEDAFKKLLTPEQLKAYNKAVKARNKIQDFIKSVGDALAADEGSPDDGVEVSEEIDYEQEVAIALQVFEEYPEELMEDNFIEQLDSDDGEMRFERELRERYEEMYSDVEDEGKREELVSAAIERVINAIRKQEDYIKNLAEDHKIFDEPVEELEAAIRESAETPSADEDLEAAAAEGAEQDPNEGQEEFSLEEELQEEGGEGIEDLSESDNPKARHHISRKEFTATEMIESWKEGSNPVQQFNSTSDPAKGPRGTLLGNYANRPYIPQFLLGGKDNVTVSQAAQAALDGKGTFSWPADCTTDESKKNYIEYVKTVEDYLNEKGAFMFVANDLAGLIKDNPRAEVTLKVDPDIKVKDAAGKAMPVVVISIRKADGTEQVIGTAITEYEYGSIKDKFRLTPAVAAMKNAETMYRTYKAIATGSIPSATTTISSYKGGYLATSSKMSPVSEVQFGSSPTKSEEGPLFAIVKNGKLMSGNPEVDSKISYDVAADVNGRAYMLVRTGDGRYIPAMVVARSITDILATNAIGIENYVSGRSETTGDWYIDQTIKAIEGILTLNNDENHDRAVFRDIYSMLPVSPDKNLLFNVEQTTEENGTRKNKKLSVPIAGSRIVVAFYTKEENGVTKTGKPKYKKTILNNTLNYVNITEKDGKLQLDRSGVIALIHYLAENGSNRIKDGNAQPLAANMSITSLENPDPQKALEYRRSIAPYMYSNLQTGLNGSHTVNDWFTFAPIAVADLDSLKEAVKGASAAAPAVTGTTTVELTVGGVKGKFTWDGKRSFRRVLPRGRGTQPVTDPGLQQRIRDAIKAQMTVAPAAAPAITEEVVELPNDDEAAPEIGEEADNSGAPELSAEDIKDGIPLDFEEDDSDSTPPAAPAKPAASRPSAAMLFGRGKKTGKPLSTDVVAESLPQLREKETSDAREGSIAFLQRVFPELAIGDSIIVVSGIIHMVDTEGNPVAAYGAYRDGILYISEDAPVGTAYHESFHYVVDRLLSDKEREEMLAVAKEKYGNDLSPLALEEKVAEDFRRFSLGYNDQSLSGKIKSVFRRLWFRIRTLVGRTEYLDAMFYDIYKGKYSNRTRTAGENPYASHDERKADYKKELQDRLLQEKADKFLYANLTDGEKEYLAERGLSEYVYSHLSPDMQENLIHCML